VKKPPRIEIKAFRRRTTIVLRDRSEVVPTGRSHGNDEASPQARAEPTRAAGSDPDQTPTTVSNTAVQSGLEQSRE
jgi:hypothetical protein